MDFGLEVFNDNLVLQINSSYKNHFLMATGTYTVTYANADYSGTLPTGVVYTGRNPFIALKNSRWVRVVRERSGNTFHFRFLWNENGPSVPSSWQLQYYVYDSLPPEPSAHGIGFQTFADDGSPIFDSGRPFCDVVGSIQQTAIFHPVTSTTRQYSYDRNNLAVACCQQAFWILETQFEGPGGTNPVPGTEYYSIRARVAGNTIYTLDTLERNNAGGPGTQSRQNNTMYLVINVNGL